MDWREVLELEALPGNGRRGRLGKDAGAVARVYRNGNWAIWERIEDAWVREVEMEELMRRAGMI